MGSLVTTIYFTDLTMKLLLVLVVAGVVSAGEDWKVFMKWAKTKAMESCWGEENMKLHTLNMKKAVAKCMQTDAPELDLPPFRAMDRLVNNMVSMAGEKEEAGEQMEMMMKMIMMMKMLEGDSMEEDSHDDMYDRMDMGDMFEKMYKIRQRSSSSSSYDFKNLMRNMRFRRDAEDALALNDRLKEKLETVMTEHMDKLSNMTCVLREMNVIDSRNNIDVAAMKADVQNYEMPS